MILYQSHVNPKMRNTRLVGASHGQGEGLAVGFVSQDAPRLHRHRWPPNDVLLLQRYAGALAEQRVETLQEGLLRALRIVEILRRVGEQ